ncbi:MAG: SulP family inorganic anion transporter [Verrucomicrobiota bacterium]
MGASQFQRRLRRILRGSGLRLLPLRQHLRSYRAGLLSRDAVAGISTALLGVPQSLAYAVIAGLPLHYGLMCAAVAGLVAPFFTGSRFTILGPTNATALMVFSYFATHPFLAQRQEELVPIICLLAGLFLIVGALFRVAEMVQYISRSVVVGYITGAAILIMGNQLRHVLGVDQAMETSGGSFFGMLFATLAAVPATNWMALGLAALTLVLYFGGRKWRPGWPIFALSLVVVSAVYALFQALGWGPSVETFVAFTADDLEPEHVNLFSAQGLEDLSVLMGVSLAVAFLASLENSVMSKSLASRTGDTVRINQDMFCVGVTNVIGSWFAGMPASGSLTRSALNYHSGAVSPLAGFLAGGLCLVGALLVGPLVPFIPKPVLAALVMGIAVSLFNRSQLRICLRATRSDAVVLVTTVLATLLVPLHVAIFLGVAVAVAFYLHKSSRPELVEYEFNEAGELAERNLSNDRAIPEISIVHVEGELYFGAAELFRDQIRRLARDPNLKVIVLRMRNARHLDATSVMALMELDAFMKEEERHLLLSGVTNSVLWVLKNSRLLEVIGKENVFPNHPNNPNVATRNALIRAQQILGTEEAEIRIFFDPNAKPPD